MSRKLVIVSATEKEIKPLLDYLQANGALISPNQFEIHNLQIELLYTGIGTMLTTYALMEYLHKGHPDGWVQIGIGGALDTSLSIGDVFQIKSEMISGEGAEQKDGRLLDPFAMGWQDPNQSPFTNGLLECPYRSSSALATGMTTFYAHGEAKAIDSLKKQMHGQIENMEGALFFYISLIKEIPFLSFRSISNFVEARDTSKWNIPLAVEQLNYTVIQWLEKSKFDMDNLFQSRLD